MRIVILPAVGSGLASMFHTGQLERLFVHLGHYANHFNLAYVTWGDPEEEERLWTPFRNQTAAQLIPARSWRVRSNADLYRAMNLLGALPAVISRRPFVMSYGADYPAIARIHGRPVWKWKALRAVALRRAVRVLVPNRVLAQSLELCYPRARITYHANWVDCERFAPTGVWGLGERRIILFVGRLVKEKNLEALAKAVAFLPNGRLVCVGEGPLRERLTSLGAECVGTQPWTSLPGWYHSADAFALPSLSEGHPKALAEAMSCGLPCLVSTAVTVGGNAVYRTDDLVEGLKELLREDVAADYGQRARAWALSEWDVRRLMPREIDYLKAAAR